MSELSLKTWQIRTLETIPSYNKNIELLGFSKGTLLYSIDEAIYTLDINKEDAPKKVFSAYQFCIRTGQDRGVAYFTSHQRGKDLKMYRWDGSKIKEIEGRFTTCIMLFDANKVYFLTRSGSPQLYQVVQIGDRFVGELLLSSLPQRYLVESVAIKDSTLYLATRAKLESFPFKPK